MKVVVILKNDVTEHSYNDIETLVPLHCDNDLHGNCDYSGSNG